MPETAFVAQALETLYRLQPQSMEPLEQFHYDWRGIYRVQDTQGQAWVMRLIQLPDVIESLNNTARILDWLVHKQYPAPSIRKTLDQQFVGVVDGWSITLLSYVEGTMLERDPNDLAAMAHTVGDLHSLHLDRDHGFATSRCHPDGIAKAIQQLVDNITKAPPAFRRLVADLHTSMVALQEMHHRICLTHGDCWPMNAIKTAEGAVTLIDWDQSGIGSPLLDLGNLLLAAHFDLSQPLQLKADESIIKAIMNGYQQQSPLDRADREVIVHATRFLLAFQLGDYLADEALSLTPEFLRVLQKLQARYDSTQAIADIARKQ